MTPALILLVALSSSACRKPTLAPQEAELSGRISLSWDESLGRGRLAVLRYLPAVVPLPAERQGIPMDTCARVTPQQALDGVLRETTVTATCGGAPLTMEANATGFWVHRFQAPPEPGLTCEVTLDGEVIALPPLPEAPDIELRLRQLRWTPGDGDEIRVVFPQADSQSTICRLIDDGEATSPTGRMPGQPVFATRHRYALPKVSDGRVSVTVTAGEWWEREPR